VSAAHVRRSSRPAWRAVAVGLLVLWAVIEWGPAITRPWYPLGTLGLISDSSGKIFSVTTGSPAALAGVEIGDRIDLRSTDSETRLSVALRSGVAPGLTVALPIVQNGRLRRVALTAQTQTFTWAENLIIVLRTIVAAVFVIIGAILVLRRPSPMTWGYFLFCLFMGNPGSNAVTDVVLPPNLYVWMAALEALVRAASVTGLLLFALSFPTQLAVGWRAFCLQLLPVLFLASSALGLYAIFAYLWHGTPVETAQRWLFGVDIAVVILSLGIFVDTFERASGDVRQRTRWVFLSLAVGLVPLAIADAFDITSLLVIPYWLYGLMQLVSGVGPFMVAYAIFRDRVVDVGFFINRAIVYGILTSLVVVIFSVSDDLFIKIFASRDSLFAELIIAAALGFWFNGMHRGVDRFVERVFFRRRQLAEQRVARAAAAVPFAHTLGAVDQLVATEPVEAFELLSAAVLARGENGEFVRRTTAGDTACGPRSVGIDDRLALILEADPAPVRLHDIQWEPAYDGEASSAPVLAVPLVARRQLQAIVLYGAHSNGADLDHDEIRSINALAVAAASAYDHLEAEALRERVAQQEAELHKLKTFG